MKIVAVSWVQFLTGTLLDLKTLGDHCHSVGAYLVVDGIQGMGQMPISFQDLPIDFLAGGSHKWMCSLNGLGYFLVKEEFKNLLSPIAFGAGSFNRFGQTADETLSLVASAKRFEPGGIGFVPIYALQESASLFAEVGVETIAKEISRLTQTLRTELLKLPNVTLVTPLTQPGGSTSFILEPTAESQFLKLCLENKIAISKRANYIRVSMHAFNDETEIFKMLELLEYTLKNE